MKVNVHLFAYLVKYSPEGKNTFSVEFKTGACVEDITKHLGIPPAEAKIILVNGRPASKDTALKENDEVTFMTPVEGG